MLYYMVSHHILLGFTILFHILSSNFVQHRNYSVSTMRLVPRWSFLGWPGSVRTTAAARLVCWRNSGPPSSSLAWTAPSPATPTSTSTYCRPWPTSSTSTAKTWWWPPSPLLTTGTLKGREADQCSAEGSCCGWKLGDWNNLLFSPLSHLHKSTSALRFAFH